MQRLHEIQVTRGLKHDKELNSTMKLPQIRPPQDSLNHPDPK